MDLTRPVVYRGFDLNTFTTGPAGVPIHGCVLETVDTSGTPAVGYTEKRALEDGLDASDVYQGGRQVQLSGTLYGSTRTNLYEQLRTLRTVFNARSCYLESPETKGFLPLTYEEPDEDGVTWPGNFIPLKLKVRPMGQIRAVINRDRTGGDDLRGLAIPWQVNCVAADPRAYVDDLQQYNFPQATSSGGPQALVNRGDYPTPANLLLEIGPAAGAGTFVITIAGFVQTITIPDSTYTQVIRLMGREKVLLLTANNVESLRMDLLAQDAKQTFPLVPPGISTYSWTCTFALNTPNSRLFYEEAMS